MVIAKPIKLVKIPLFIFFSGLKKLEVMPEMIKKEPAIENCHILFNNVPSYQDIWW